MTEEKPDLTLPSRLPEAAKYHKKRMGNQAFAFYSLCNLDDNTAKAYRKICTADLNKDAVKSPPQWKFPQAALNEIVKYHIDLVADNDEFAWRYFIVCLYEGSHTVVIVTLDDDDGECKPDSFWIEMEEAGIICANLHIANMNWGEAKEDRPDGPQMRLPAPGLDSH